MELFIVSKYFRLILFTCVVVIEFLATTTREIEVVSGMWDKSNHFLAFFTLYILLSLSYTSMNLQVKVLWLMAFAFQIEIIQHFIEGRFFSLLDIVADFIGIIMGLIAFKVLERVYPSKIV